MPYINADFELQFDSLADEVTKILARELEPSVRLRRLEDSVLQYTISREFLQKGHQFEYEFIALRGQKSGSTPKRIRPAIVIYIGLGNGCRDVQFLKYASQGPELLHGSTLIHDDIHDKDEARSNEPTVWKKWYDYLEGKVPENERLHRAYSLAIDSGDRVMHMPYDVMSKTNFSDKQVRAANNAISMAISDITRGQDLDLSYSGRIDDIIAGRLLEEEIFEMYGLKTGALFDLCAFLGLVFSDGTGNQMNHASLWARRYFNLRFQIHDDFIENNIDGVKGKAVGRDIVEGKLTPLVIRTLRKGPEYAKPVRDVMFNREATEQQIMSAIDAFHDSGSVGELRDFKEEMGEKGKAEVEMMELMSPHKEDLIDLTEYVGVRTR